MDILPPDDALIQGDGFENMSDFQSSLDASDVRDPIDVDVGEDLESEEIVEDETPSYEDHGRERVNNDENDDGEDIDCCELLKERCNFYW